MADNQKKRIAFFQRFFAEKIYRVEKIPRQASFRKYYRLYLGEKIIIALIYPRDKTAEIERYLFFYKTLREHQLPLAEVFDVLENHILLLEDLGKVHLNNLRPAEIISGYSQQLMELLAKLAAVPLNATSSKLDADRLKFEFDFFLEHFFSEYSCGFEKKILLEDLDNLRRSIGSPEVFAHRDFHSRNILLKSGKLYLVDFQDALQAPRYYDLVSLIFDSYIDYHKYRKEFVCIFEKANRKRVDSVQFLRTALQRNIKALGTFGFQVFKNKNRQYQRYILPTLSYINSHLTFFRKEFAVLKDYFSSVSGSITGRIRRDGYSEE